MLIRTACAAAVVCTTALLAVPASPSLAAPAATSPAGTQTPAFSTVASGAAQSLGEPAAAQDAAVSAVAATHFGPDGAAQVQAWTRPAGASSWQAAGLVLPAGFGSSYDPAATALPGGPVLLVAGAAPAGQNCIANGSVAITQVYPGGQLGTARIVSDQRGTGRFDDRPAVAAGPGGTVWVAWSEGKNADACQNVGTDDRMMVAVSHDDGKTFGAPVAMPAAGGHAAFGARLAPLGGGRVAVSWTETMPAGGQAVLVSVLGPGRQASQPQAVLTGAALPMILPGASFYDFPAGDITALSDGTLVVAAPFWLSGHSVVEVAAGQPGGTWQPAVVSPPAGADLLLPALGPFGTTGVWLLCAVHSRAGDRVGYYGADLPAGTWSAPLKRLTSTPAGPGFFEIGEEGSMTQTPNGLIAPVVIAGAGGAKLKTLSWTTPRPPPAARPSASQPASQPARGGPAAADPASGGTSAATWAAIVLAIVIAVGGVTVAALRARVRARQRERARARGTRRRPSRSYPGPRRLPGPAPLSRTWCPDGWTGGPCSSRRSAAPAGPPSCRG
jgi:hypothetical protein